MSFCVIDGELSEDGNTRWAEWMVPRTRRDNSGREREQSASPIHVQTQPEACLLQMRAIRGAHILIWFSIKNDVSRSIGPVGFLAGGFCSLLALRFAAESLRRSVESLVCCFLTDAP